MVTITRIIHSFRCATNEKNENNNRIVVGMMCVGRNLSFSSIYSLRVLFGWRGKIGCLCLSLSSENGKHKRTNICVELTQICVLS